MSFTENDEQIRILSYALDMERSGRVFFQDALQRMENTYAAGAFLRIIEEETRHIELLSEKLDAAGNKDFGTLPEFGSVLPAPAAYFDLGARADFVHRVKENPGCPDLAVFNAAWEIEKNISEFYGRAAGRARGGLKRLFDGLLEWENRHELFFRDFRKKLQETYSRAYLDSPWG